VHSQYTSHISGSWTNRTRRFISTERQSPLKTADFFSKPKTSINNVFVSRTSLVPYSTRTSQHSVFSLSYFYFKIKVKLSFCMVKLDAMKTCWGWRYNSMHPPFQHYMEVMVTFTPRPLFSVIIC